MQNHNPEAIGRSMSDGWRRHGRKPRPPESPIFPARYTAASSPTMRNRRGTHESGSLRKRSPDARRSGCHGLDWGMVSECACPAPEEARIAERRVVSHNLELIGSAKAPGGPPGLQIGRIWEQVISHIHVFIVLSVVTLFVRVCFLTSMLRVGRTT